MTASSKQSVVVSLIAGLFGVSVVIGLSGWIVGKTLSNWEHAGQFGDMFGFANALLSGIALVLLVLTLKLQSEELRHQRHEIGLQREALQLQREEMTEHTRIFRRSYVLERIHLRASTLPCFTINEQHMAEGFKLYLDDNRAYNITIQDQDDKTLFTKDTMDPGDSAELCLPRNLSQENPAVLRFKSQTTEEFEVRIFYDIEHGRKITWSAPYPVLEEDLR